MLYLTCLTELEAKSLKFFLSNGTRVEPVKFVFLKNRTHWNRYTD